MTSTAAFEMAMVHRFFRNELHRVPGLINGVGAGDVKRAAVVNAHLSFIVAVLHHHHAAEDDLIWPKLHARVPLYDHDIRRMEDEHRAIAAGIHTAKATGSAWAKTGAPSASEQLRKAVDALTGLVDAHLDDEERDVVPLIEDCITAPEWKKVTARGASFLRTHPRLGLVFAGCVLEGVPDEDKHRFLAGVPWAARMMWQLVGTRTYEGYRAKLYSPAPYIRIPRAVESRVQEHRLRRTTTRLTRPGVVRKLADSRTRKLFHSKRSRSSVGTGGSAARRR
jgi:Hemerythrin HHE cation binding domain